MSNLLVVYERDIATVSLMKRVLQALSRKTEINIVFCRAMDVKAPIIDSIDTIMMIRPQDICSWNVAKAAKKAGVFLIFFCDDDLLNMPATYPHIPWRLKSMKNILLNSDTVLSSSKDICERYGEACKGKRSGIINTVVTSQELAEIPDKGPVNGIKIVYAAGGDHAELFHSFVEPTLHQLDKRYGKKISLTFVGVHPGIDESKYTFRIYYKENMLLQDYRNYMRQEHFDIGLAPLHSNLVNDCKYFNKFIEYTLVGTVGIYSNCKPYTLVVRDGENGFLADNTKDGWFEAICHAIDRPVLRQECLKNAIQYLKREHNTEKIGEQLFRDIPELRRKTKHKRKCENLVLGKVLYKLFRVGDIIYLFFFYLKREDISSLLVRIERHFPATCSR